MKGLLGRQITRFLLVGCLGFLVDAGLLYFLVSGGANPYTMRLVSFTVAVSVTWYCNRSWTFTDRSRRGTRQEYISYVGVQLFGAAVNYVVYALCLSAIGISSANAVLALACGSIAALAVNFIGARRIVFQARAQ